MKVDEIDIAKLKCINAGKKSPFVMKKKPCKLKLQIIVNELIKCIYSYIKFVLNP